MQLYARVFASCVAAFNIQWAGIHQQPLNRRRRWAAAKSAYPQYRFNVCVHVYKRRRRRRKVVGN